MTIFFFYASDCGKIRLQNNNIFNKYLNTKNMQYYDGCEIKSIKKEVEQDVPTRVLKISTNGRNLFSLEERLQRMRSKANKKEITLNTDTNQSNDDSITV